MSSEAVSRFRYDRFFIFYYLLKPNIIYFFQEEITKKELEKPPSPKPDTAEGSSKPSTPTKEGIFSKSYFFCVVN